MSVGARVRRAVHVVVVTAIAIVLAAPLLLGPGANAVMRALGATEVHRCACGMKQGACGCPECERLEHAREHETEMLRAHAVLKSTCDGDGAIAGYSAIPAFAAPLASVLPAPAYEQRSFVAAPDFDPPLERARPPTPPPRSSSV
ncbi:MAG TPA: hypothetical protein VIF62_19750 [Labilithrix sp.]